MDQEKQNDTFTPENAAPQGAQPETTPPAPQEVQPGTTLPAPQDDPLEIPTAELQEDSSAPSVSLPDPVETAFIDDLFAGSSDQDPSESAPPVGERTPEEPRSAHTIDDVYALLERLGVEFERKLKYDAKKDQMVDALHAENSEYKKDVRWSVKKDLVESFIHEIDDVEKRWKPSKLDEIPSDPEELAREHKRLLKYLCVELPENLRFALESHDIYAYTSEPGLEFDPKTQRALRTSSTDKPELDKTTRPMRPGYKTIVRGQETVIRPELVEVFKYAPPAPTQETGESPQGASELVQGVGESSQDVSELIRGVGESKQGPPAPDSPTL